MHFHSNLLFDPAFIFLGSQPNAILAIFGWVLTKSVFPCIASKPEQYGQPKPFALVWIAAVQICFFEHIHSTFLPLPMVTVCGSHLYACFANCGFTDCKSLKPICTFLPAHIGQLLPLTFDLLQMIASNLWLREHFQLSFFPLPAVTVVGSQPFACWANSGWVTESGCFSFLVGTR